MDAWRVWTRLLWKEWRESGIVLAVGTALPQILLRWHEKPVVQYFAFAVLILLITLWAIQRVVDSGEGKTLRLCLPISPWMRIVVLYVIPLPVPLMIGASLGFFLNRCLLNVDSQISPVSTGILLLLLLFTLSTTISLIYGFISAIIIGLLVLLITIEPGIIYEYQHIILAGYPLDASDHYL